MTAPLAIVTGASRGIGRYLAQSLADGGYAVAYTHLASASDADKLANDIKRDGGQAFSMECDAGSKAQVERFYNAVMSWYGHAPALLVNNAGIQTWSGLLDLDESDWDRVINTNLKGCFLNTQAVGALMKQHGQGGSIVNIGSGCNKVAFPRLVDYTASKGGIEQLTKVAAVELGPFGITVNCVAPGAIATERTALESPDYAASWIPLTPLRRIGTPADVAGVVRFLASRAASFVTGQTIGVDGGVFTCAPWPYPHDAPA